MTRNLVLLRGAMGAGKSTFIKDLELEPYTLSPDVIRMQFAGPVHNATDGRPTISSSHESEVWKFLFERLEERMKRGETIFIDATHVKQSAISAYRKYVDKYHYRTWTINFNHKSNKEIFEQNLKRPPHKRVDNDVVLNALSRMETEYVPKWANPMSPKEFHERFTWEPTLMSEMEEKHILVIGDIHGSYEALVELMDKYAESRFEPEIEMTPSTGIKVVKDTLYVFLGDYFDRGSSIVCTWRAINELQDFKNVITLQGNHETHFIDFLNYLKLSGESIDEVKTEEFKAKFLDREWRRENKELYELIRSKRFREETLHLLADYGVTKADIVRFTSRLRQMATFMTKPSTWESVQLVMTHGGITKPERDLIYYSTQELVDGVGTYSDDIDTLWNKQDQTPMYQFHGHRNQFDNPIINGRSFNLEGGVEVGGYLRAVHIGDERFVPIEVKNDNFNIMNISDRLEFNVETPVTPKEFAEYSQANPNQVQMKEQANGNVSFNFSSRVFRSDKWNQVTSHARGLFMKEQDNGSWEVVARSYNKFFNDEQRRSTEANRLRQTVTFPVQVFKKYNGFLGLIGYDKTTGEPFVSSKAVQDISTKDTYANWVKDVFIEVYGQEHFDKVVALSKELDSTFIFEIIDPQHDAHIIHYDEPRAVLLDIIKNTMQFQKVSYGRLRDINATDFNGELELKEEAAFFETWGEFYRWYLKQKDTMEDKIEGYVVQEFPGEYMWEKNPFMWKVKSNFYTTWKKMRGSLNQLVSKAHNGSGSPEIHGRFTKPIENSFIKYIQTRTTYKEELNRLGKPINQKYLLTYSGHLIKESSDNMAALVKAFYDEVVNG